MSISTNKTLVKSFVEEVFNNHNLEAIERYLAEQGRVGFKQKKEGFKQSLSAQFKAFPDIQVEIEHIIAENDLVVVFLRFTGTHKGEFRGRPPTNKRVNIRSADLYRVENGKIVEHWDVVDQLDLLQQTGVTLS
jgi:steroid delta-isomerase-like uncharacterized protein